MAPWAYGLRAAGYRVLLPNYPLGDVLRSEQWTQRLMRRVHGWKAAWGVSAGGTIASWLAGRGAVDAAVNAAGPTDLLTWRTPFAGYLLHNTSTRECIAASPMRTLTRAAAPQLLQYGTRDSLIPVSQGLVYARRARRVQPATRLEVTGDGHGQTRVQAMRALAWMRHLNAAS
jgi:pimeloyl-ACP methyl ester carboxylesterase